ncbi:MAG TPA: CBS domain-containing protein [Pyrinomonadaceae bacterium]|jgi:CBS domain-containing protein
MKVREIMTGAVGSCGMETNLAAAARIMWDKDCGSVPVLDNDGHVIGMITDRDICMALTTRNRLASEVLVGDVISGVVKTCAPDDEVVEALQAMRGEQLRRLPVVDSEGELVGIISINDVILNSKKGKSKKGAHVSHADVMDALKSLSQHRAPVLDGLA